VLGIIKVGNNPTRLELFNRAGIPGSNLVNYSPMCGKNTNSRYAEASETEEERVKSHIIQVSQEVRGHNEREKMYIFQ
jgi:hypothetical protein